MSKYGWEAGTIVLPSAAVAPVKGAIRTAALAHRATVEAAVRECRAGCTSRSVNAWTAHIDTWLHTAARSTSRDPWARSRFDTQTLNDICEVLHRLGTPRNPTVADFDAVLGAKPTNRTTVFRADEATVSFDGRNVRWHTGDNNHAVEHAHESWLGAAFFAALAKVNWTRGTGGTLVGNDEYNQDNCDAGGGANYETARFGPAVQRRGRTAPLRAW